VSGAGFLLDVHRCVGCGACVLACRIENGRVREAAWRRVLPLNLARRPGGPTYSLSVACHHCDEPACLKGCPADAYEKRPDGIVIHHEERCIGCRYCEMTCPFGAPLFDAARGVMSKCHDCAPRVDAGLEPACVVACPTGALGVLDKGRLACPEPSRGTSQPDVQPRAFIPGFVDPAGCGPNLRFHLLDGTRRAELLRALEEALRP
jgi:Fe-S-cluster-containing dehydrogenase component